MYKRKPSSFGRGAGGIARSSGMGSMRLIAVVGVLVSGESNNSNFPTVSNDSF